jgi:uncharacterized protein with HEPN domain
MPSEDPRRRLDDMADNLRRIRAYVAGCDKDRFLADTMVQDAVERCFERIAEAARKLGDVYDARYPDAGLPQLRRFGSVLRHDYDTVHPELMWGFVQHRMEGLETMVADALAALD